MNGWLDLGAAGPVLTPLVIFVAEMCVVTIGTTRTIFVSRGMKAPAALLGVFECSLWLLAVGQVFQNLSNLGCSAAYAGGFSLGNYLGVLLEEKLAVGSVLLRVITRRDAAPLIQNLAAADYGVTRLDGRARSAPSRSSSPSSNAASWGTSSASSSASTLAPSTRWMICSRRRPASSR